MLDGLFVTSTATAVLEALASARADGPIAVLGDAKLAAALGETREVTAVGVPGRAAKKLPRVVDDVGALERGAFAALVGPDEGDEGEPGWEDRLRAWTPAVRDGGVLVLVHRGAASEASRRALCSGLTELEQRQVGRSVITSGVVWALPGTD